MSSNPKSRNNLISFGQRPLEEERKIQSKGGKASVKKKRIRKKIRELVDIIFSLPLDKSRKPVNLDKLRSFQDLNGANLTPAIAGIGKLAQQVAKGDLNAIKLWFELTGEGRQQNLKLSGSLDVTQNHDFSGLSDEEVCALAELVAKVNDPALDL